MELWEPSSTFSSENFPNNYPNQAFCKSFFSKSSGKIQPYKINDTKSAFPRQMLSSKEDLSHIQWDLLTEVYMVLSRSKGIMCQLIKK